MIKKKMSLFSLRKALNSSVDLKYVIILLSLRTRTSFRAPKILKVALSLLKRNEPRVSKGRVASMSIVNWPVR